MDNSEPPKQLLDSQWDTYDFKHACQVSVQKVLPEVDVQHCGSVLVLEEAIERK